MVTLLHTTESHCATFNELRDRISPDTELVHIVRPDFLTRAQSVMDRALSRDIAQVVQKATGTVLCTCTTIGMAANNAGAIRIDLPMMQAAARVGGPVLLTCCLESTRAQSRQLLQAEMSAAGTEGPVHELFLGEFWPLFEAGQTEAFHAVIASAVRAHLAESPDVSAIVLAQASMAGAEAMLKDVAVPVLSSPELALRAAIG